MPENMIDNIDRLIALSEEKIATLKELRRCLLIADLLGLRPADVKDVVRITYHPSDNVLRPWQGTIMTVRVGDGPLEDFALTNVDKRLWPDDIRAAYEKWEARNRKGKTNAKP